MPGIAEIEAEQAGLVFAAFDETTALALGMALVQRAQADAMPVVIDIRTPDRVLFHAAMPGSGPLNDQWARRKANTALYFQAPSMLVTLRLAEKSGGLDRHGLDPANYAASGGSVPIRVRGVGVIATATVSGLAQEEDHAVVVTAIRDLLRQSTA